MNYILIHLICAYNWLEFINAFLKKIMGVYIQECDKILNKEVLFFLIGNLRKYWFKTVLLWS